MESLVNFGVMVSVQFVIFCAFYFYNGVYKQTKFLPLLINSCLVGIPFGMSFDFLIGHYVGIFLYTLGFGVPFLFFNGLLSYGFMIATVWTMSSLSFFRFYFQTIVVGALYEAVNFYFPVWEWTFFSAPWQEYLTVIGAAYMGLSALMALALWLVIRTKFVFLHSRT